MSYLNLTSTVHDMVEASSAATIETAMRSQTMFAFAEEEMLIALAEQNSQNELALLITPQADHFQGTFLYDASLFDEATIAQMARHFVQLLEGVMSEPDRPIRAIQILTADEQQQLQESWSGKALDYPRGVCLHELLAAQAARTPTHTAVVCGDESLTYQELDRRANQLAHRLIKMGVMPETLVGILAERSIEMAVSMIGVMKAGGAYVPLDPAYPKERLAYMLQDTNVPILLTEQHLLADLPAHSAEVICLDSEGEALATEPSAAPQTAVTENNLAYVIYTSGSTGNPKGVLVEHKTFVPYVYSILDGLNLRADDRVLQFAPITFDATVEELYPAWIVGATVVLRPNRLFAPNREFSRYVEAQALTVLSLPTAYWHEWAFELHQSGTRVPPHLRMVLLNAEEPAMERFQMWWQIGGDQVETINTYGPTETTVTASLFTPTPADRNRTRIPIGRPMAGVRMYVLDHHLQPVPSGVIGELYIGGIGPSRGYLNLPELTAESFVPDHQSNLPDARMYKTGDLVRTLPDGNIEYCGRSDHQVKIRGFRIELGEIESVLIQHPNVKETVVLAHELHATEKRLVAYVVPVQASQAQEASWREYLAEKLPAHMVPAAFVSIASFPLTPNGKVDKKALPVPVFSRERTVDYVAPRTHDETLLVAIYEQVLQTAGIGVEDNFFEWGGHSLLATQVISRVRDAFEKELTLADFFAAPTIAELADALRTNAALSDRTISLERAVGLRQAPMSSAQQRLWFLDQMEPGSAVYNIPTAIKLTGELDASVLERALQEIVIRHEALRTTFAEAEGQPIQIVHDSLRADWQVVDLTELPEEERESKAFEQMNRDAEQPFDLTVGPLLRTQLIRLSETEHLLLLNIHHIVSDGWSLGLLTSELSALYAALIAGDLSPLAELPVQYGDYARWQQRNLQAEQVEQQLLYWKKQIGSDLPVLQLPADKPRPARPTDRGNLQKRRVPADLLRTLEQLSLREGATLYMTMLSAFKALLYRYTGQENISVGTPIAGRTRREVEDLIGFFVNTLVMRTDLQGMMTFRDLLHDVRSVSLGAFAHQDIPFEKVVEEIAPVRDGSQTPLFQTMFVFENTSLVQRDVANLTWQPFDIHNGTAKFDLTMEFVEEADGLHVSFEYKTDLFSDAMIERMLEHFLNLLQSIAQDATQPIAQLQMLGAEEQELLLHAWNDTVTPYPKRSSIAELFAEQVRTNPDAIALVEEDLCLTYHQLNVEANRLANRMIRAGVAPQDLVGLLLERSVEAVVTMLAILKAGAVYVPLDPTYPQERLSNMLEDAEVKLLITKQKWLSRLPAEFGQVLCLDLERESICGESEQNPACATTPDSLAYVIFTSGSTGRPKGVCVPQRGVVRLVKNTNYIQFDREDVFIQFAPISFDAATFEIWGSLLNGAKLVLYSEPDLSFHALGRMIREHRVSTLWLTAGLFLQMVEEHLEDMTSVRYLLAGGDVLSVPHVRKALLALPNCTLINGYGPTENTTFTCCNPMTDVEQIGATVSIGRPISNTQVYVLDTDLNPVPLGVPGELHIGGDGLATSYLKRPDLTAEKFIAHPYGESDEKLYKTGDLVRWLPDGNIEFLGRIDGQIKIRGFRIELGEIESVIGAHESVESNVVIARELPSGDKRLYAYVVYKPGAAVLSNGEWRKHLADLLPDYMMPAAFLTLDSMPITQNGKVDKRALPEPDNDALFEQNTYVAPRMPLEAQIAATWAEVLSAERVGIHDNFFALGGHSLLAMQVMSRLRDILGKDLPLRLLFEATTVATFVERLQEEQGSAVLTASIARTERGGRPQASFAQQRLWFLAQWEPNSALYNIPFAWRIKGALDADLLERALDEIVKRHETLRTTFAEEDGQPVLIIDETSNWQLVRIDLRAHPATEAEQEAMRIAKADACQPFSLTDGPLWRTTLISLADDDHLFIVNQHHIISDGWSLGVFTRELATLYRSFAAGQPEALEELPVQYADYAIWQAQTLQGDRLEHQLSYWREQLSGERPLLQLPTDRPRQPQQTFAGSVETALLSPEISAKIRQVGQSAGATLYMTLLTAFQTLLYRYTGQEDIWIGTPVSGRNHQEIEGLIGFFVNTLVIRADLSGELSFGDLLRQTKQNTLDAQAHQDLPFEKLVEQLETERDLSHSALFQVMFSVEPSDIQTVELDGQSWQALELENDTAKFELSFTMREEADRLFLAVEYNRDLFEQATIVRMIEHFQSLLQEIAARPGDKLSELSLLPAKEREQVLSGWNDTATEYPQLSIPQLFEAQAMQTPTSVALQDRQGEMTYRDLNERANQLAHVLRRQGVGPDVLVGLCMERSFEMVIGLLGILKAGGAYVPLDPNYPAERLAFMLEDAQVSLLLTQEHLRQTLPAHGAEVICLDSEWSAKIAGESCDNLPCRNELEDLAYVNYTSGSTGQPKGVCVPHRGVVRLVKNTNYIQFDREDVFLQFAPISFDAATLEIWGSLLNGAKLVLYSEPSLSLPALGRTIREHRVTTLWLTAGLFHQMVEEHLDDLSSVRYLLAGGDVLSVPHVKKALQALPNSTLINGYGPTENTTFTCCYQMTDPEQVGASVSIGRPIANTQVYVLDAQLSPVPIGVPGELHIAGDGLARGYLNRPELDEEKFIANPFGKPEERLYKTGDLVRWLADGNIEFLGRIDGQVKIRGFRIELGEIEAVIGEHLSVRENVVIAHADDHGQKRLIAYIVPSEAGEFDRAALRSYLKERMPEYMVPAAIISLPELPLNPNGKVDKRALPAPNLAESFADQAYSAPRNWTEELIAGIWSQVLQVEQVGIHDNFFELGGHSLLATQVMSRLRSALQTEMTLRQLFEAPTIAEFAKRVEASSRLINDRAPIQRVAREQDLPLSFAQQRLWIIDQLEPGQTTYNVPIALQIERAVDISVLQRCVEEILNRHEALRTTFAVRAGEPVQQIRPLEDFELPIVDLQAVPIEQRQPQAERLIQAEARQPFDLQTGPLCRTLLILMSADESILVWNMHHIVADGWSLGVLMNELSALYAAFTQDLPSPLAELPVQYADYAVWQRAWLDGEMQNQLDYWQQQLAGHQPFLQLPTDRPRPALLTEHGADHTLHLPADLSHRLQQISRNEGTTLFMTLFAAFNVLLHRYSGQDDMLVGTPIAGRNHSEVEGLIGFFVNTLVLRTQMQEQMTFRDLLQQVRNTTLEAYAHQDLPFEKLVEEINPDRDQSRTPLFQVLFSLETASQQGSQSILPMRAIQVDNDTSKFDLTLVMSEEAEGLTASFNYNVDLFDEATIVRMTEHFQSLLREIVARPGDKLSELSFLLAEEREQVLSGWNDTVTEYPQLSIPQLFEAQAMQTPESVALQDQQGEMTYRDLNERANQLAHVLRRQGVGPDVLVGLCMERSFEMVIGLLGILKAGGAYVPLDPNYPAERLAFMLEDAQVSLLLTQEHLRQTLPAHGAEVICLDSEWSAKIAGESCDNLPCRNELEDLAYVNYTSGSTGQPKGVCVPHRGVVRLVKNTNYIQFDREDVFLQFAPISFDAATFEIWGSLLNGAKLVIFPPNLPTLAELGRTLTDYQVTSIFLTTALFNQMVEHQLDDLQSVRQLLTGGEVMSVPHVKLALERLPNCRLSNVYGPTESTTFTSFYPMPTAEYAKSPVPIGRPIANTQVYVLDAQLNLAPIGVPGELHIGGDGLARGYLNRPELDEEKFIANLFGKPEERLYKTGDLVRWLADGNIEFLGRIDGQVKIRGFRIELGEIEAVIGEHLSVRENVVIAHADDRGQKRLIAYIVPSEAGEFDRAALRSYLKERMPEYMVPAVIISLPELPLNPNGKVDKRALPAPNLAESFADQAYSAPRNWTEELIAGIWSQVLQVEQVGIHDNFFELGGHSLLATQVMSRLRSALQTEMTLRQLFEAPTIAEFAKRVEASSRLINDRAPIQRVAREQDLPLSFAQQRLWILDQLEPGQTTYNVPIALQIGRAVDISVLQRCVEEILNRHEALRTTFVVRAGEPVQQIRPLEDFELPIVDLQAMPVEQRQPQAERLIQAEARQPFDLQTGPLCRTLLILMSSDESILVWNMHHIVADGWSLGVLMNELSALYAAFTQDLPSPLAELPVQYADYAVWQRAWLDGEMQNQLDYWQQQLAGHQPFLQLPTDRPRPALLTEHGADHTLHLPADLSHRLQQISRNEGTTLFMTLFAAFNVLLHRYSGQDDMLVGTPIAGRNHSEVEGLIGFFVNTLVLRTQMQEQMTFHDLLQQVRNTTLEAYAHQDLPFEKLIEEINPDRDTSRTPLIQVMFSLDAADQQGSQSILPMRAIQVDNDTSKFDLSLAMSQEEDGLSATFNYNTDLFDEATIVRMTEHFHVLLRQLVEATDRQLSELSLLTEQEQHLLLHTWNDTNAAPAHDLCIHQLIEQQVERTPESIAIVFEQERLTYRELNERANRLAHHLQALGVGPDVLVTLCLERSLELVIGVLGILKAGGAYVPLDTAYPEERMQLILEDTQARVLVTQSHLLPKLSGSSELIVCLDTDWAEIATQPATIPQSDVRPQHLAYMIYTSGSTGRPKAVMVEHGNLVSTLLASQERFRFCAEDVLPWIASVAFDIALFELMNPLLTGGTSVVLAREHVLDLPQLVEELKGYTSIHTVPSLMRQIVQTINEQDEQHQAFDKIRLIFIGGDAVPPDLLEAMYKVFQNAEIHVLYGPTEGTIICSSYFVPRDVHLHRLLIGTRLPNSNLRVYDAHQNLLPAGIPGELYIGGAGVSRGYYQREELTEEKFVTIEGQRWYRTGDLTRYLADGTLEFLGRIDNQVKIRGFRIEIGEIETVLTQHPHVHESVVIVQEGENGDKRLAAYVVPTEGESVDSAELRTYLKEKLPEYMVPSFLVLLEQLPLNPNGKIDRRALPAPDASAMEAGVYVAPRTAVEEIIASVWASVLGLERVSVEDNFFALGGHSLLATQVMSRLRSELQSEISLRQLFEAPTIAELAKRVETSSLLANDRTPIEQVNRDQDLPLSFAQQRLWFLDQLEPDSTAYNMTFTLHLRGQLNTDAMEQSLREIVRRHESLRTTFAEVDGQPRQIIHSNPPFAVPVYSLSEAELQNRMKQAAEMQYDLTTGPLFDAEIIRLADEEHVLLVSMHHIVSDGWSIGVFTQELSALYEAYDAGLPSPLSELKIQYADFAVWQHSWLTGDVLDRQLSYWKHQLGGELPPLQLPTDHPRPEQPTHRGEVLVVEIPGDLAEQLHALGNEMGATLFMTLLTAFKTLLYRYTGESDQRVGTPIAGRNREEIEGLIGFFVNTLVLRTDLSAAPTFRDLLSRVREVTLGAYAHQDLPFERLVEELQPGRDVSHSPLFEAMFILQNAGAGTWELPGLDVKTLDQEELSAQFDLLLTVTEKADGLDISIVYSTDLYEADSIQRMAGHLHTLLEAMVADPDQAITLAPMLTQAERQRLLIDLNQTETDYPREACAHHLFEAQVEKTPDRIALAFEEERISYAELNARANRLARHLQQQGVQPDTLVGIFLDRSPEMIVSVLAVLKAGGGYVPLDPAYPADRLSYMLEDTQVPLIITQSELADRLPQHDHTVTLICLDQNARSIEAESADNVRSSTGPEHLAYVIYTSGSTGRPKGVLLEHRGLCNLAGEQIANFAIEETSRVLQFASFNFDVSVSEIFAALFSGAMLVLAPREKLLPGPELAQLMRDMEITVIMLTASVLGVLFDEEFPALRTVVTGGEAASAEVVTRWSKGRRFVNVYGATEATVYSTYAAYTDASHALDIGVPIANTTLYLLDANMQPVPVGVPGECYIGGEALARGYLNRPELNAEKFLSDPFSEQPGARLYKTGDLLVHTADGKMEFVGRIDNQVKIRGFRVELGEIETALGQHVIVRESVVLVREDTPGFKRLAAYVVPKVVGDEQEIVAQLRTALKSRFPDYMVPSAIVLLDRFPMTPNGKVDKAALPIPAERLGLEQAYVAPRGETEANVADIWSQLLGVEQVGIYDNFFELGGHSLLATQVISRLRKSFQADVPLRLLFEGPTVAQLADALDRLRGGAPSLLDHPMLPVERDRKLPLSYAQQRLWFLDKLEPGSTAYNSPSALRMQGKIDLAALEDSLQLIVDRHESLRTTFEEIDGHPVQVIAPTAKFAVEMIDLSDLAPSERQAQTRRLLQEDDRWQFDLSAGPLFRARIVRVEAEEHLLLLNMHHIISDGWSMGVFGQELAACYEAFCNGDLVQLPELPIQYADFASWQQELLQGDLLDAQLSYWQERLSGHLPVLQLPTDAPRPAKQTFHGSSVSLTLPKALSERLAQIGQEEATTLYMTLLAAFKVLLYRYTGQEDVLVGTPVAGRNREEIEGLIGFFVNTLVLRSALSDDLTFRQLLAQVREVALGAYAYQDVPFEKLVEVLAPDRDMSYTPLFQVMFTFQNAEDYEMRLPGLAVSYIEPEHQSAKFDLTLAMASDADGLSASMEYNTDLFQRETIERMMQHFQNLLAAIAEDADRTLSALPLLQAEERSRLLSMWQEHSIDASIESTIHQRFEEQVKRTPDRIALTDQDRHFTYREVNEQANRIAHRLQQLGVKNETLVGLMVERSAEVVIGILAILKAGGAYVPFDPTYPAERLAFMLEDSQVSALLTEERYAADLPPHDAHVICFDRDQEEIERQSSENLTSGATAESLAYVIYTSGSTGKPKGVLIEHANVTRLFASTDAWYQFGEADVWTLFHSYAFDFSVWEIWGALLYGGRLVVVPYLVSRSPEAFHRLLCEEGVTVLNQTPSAFYQLMQADELASSTDRLSLRYVVFGGEALELQSLKSWFARHGDQQPQLVNMYGITETTVHVTYRPIRLVDLEKGAGSVIGLPIPDLQLYVLDSNLQPVPFGVTGEMYVGGAGVARGYLQRPELTAERFIDNPFRANGEKLYRTGDLARLLSNGELEYQGRIDHQVKIRGFRIELGEIEAVLSGHPAVKTSVVIAREDTPSNKRLVAYFVQQAEQEVLTSGDLRRYLQDQLPDYMVPSAFVPLDTLPLTANGKVDKRALPAPEAAGAASETEYVAPRSYKEQQMADIWADVLGVERVGVKDNFFALGGHSLLAVRLMAEIRKHLHADLPLSLLFQEGTVEQMTTHLSDEKGTGHSLVPMKPSGSKLPYFFVHPGGGAVFGYLDLVRALDPEQPFYAFQAKGLEDDQEPLEHVEAMAERYIEEMRMVQAQGPYHLGGWSFGGIVAHEMAKQLREQGEEVAMLTLLDSHAPGWTNEEDLDEETIFYSFALDLTSQFGIEMPDAVEDDNWELSSALDQLYQAVMAAQALPFDQGSEVFARMYRVFRANLLAYARYIPARPYSGHWMLLKAQEQDPLLDRGELLGWTDLEVEQIAVATVPGNHFSMMKQPQVLALVDQLAQQVEEQIKI
ncbi:non-ribosomal peptide synthase/polyketide synthase [Tumebacillus lipolyticus]|uniref:Non-ribosomal peptide synthase/polyketide synthase n=1 Tax=Tumebacillus lipolyticus TaxID=1280370 RepID=A0ABW4ZRJ5_9BACL